MARILLVALAAATLAAAPSAAHAATTTLQVVAVGGGSVTVTPGPLDPNENCANPLSGGRDAITSCAMTYEVGTLLTLSATGADADSDGPATALANWSEERCPSTTSCTVNVGADRLSVAALFTPQRVSVNLLGLGSATSEPAGLAAPDGGPCTTPDPDALFTCWTDVPLGTNVVLNAAPTDPATTATWAPKAVTAALFLCNSETPPPCVVTADRPRWGSVGFDVAPDNTQIPPEVSVDFQVRKAGSGSGLVHGETINCGNECTSDRTFGAHETLVADADRGSHFDHWRGACGAAPTCSLAVGPVTALTAFFERGPTQPGGPEPSRRPSLSTRVLRLNVRGHGRKRAILVRLQVNATATVRAVLRSGRRQLAARRWRLRAGTHLLRFRVPVRARPGVYRLRLIVQGYGQTKQLTQRVRLRR
jgi:Divergent InlB B-repeat domain